MVTPMEDVFSCQQHFHSRTPIMKTRTDVRRGLSVDAALRSTR